MSRFSPEEGGEAHPTGYKQCSNYRREWGGFPPYYLSSSLALLLAALLVLSPPRLQRGMGIEKYPISIPIPPSTFLLIRALVTKANLVWGRNLRKGRTSFMGGTECGKCENWGRELVTTIRPNTFKGARKLPQ